MKRLNSAPTYKKILPKKLTNFGLKKQFHSYFYVCIKKTSLKRSKFDQPLSRAIAGFLLLWSLKTSREMLKYCIVSLICSFSQYSTYELHCIIENIVYYPFRCAALHDRGDESERIHVSLKCHLPTLSFSSRNENKP